ncbi:MAG TPA: glycosyl hydrolase, partial [Candidatus Saccharimonadales bacterium]|nr:glycosyl hydrolase [Candidatus Saccharimonadales bacterium]
MLCGIQFKMFSHAWFLLFVTARGGSFKGVRRLAWVILFALLLILAPFAHAETLDIQDAVRTYASLTNTTVSLSGRAELRITGTGDPLPGCVIHLNSPDAWLLLPAIAPSQFASTLLSRVRVGGVNAVIDSNVRLAQYGRGVMVIPQGPTFSPLEVFDGRFFTGPSKRLYSYVEYNNALLGQMAGTIGSFKLKRGYVATFSQSENGTGASRCYVAQDGDLEVGLLPSTLENNIHYVRIFPWRWVGKKGIAGNIEAGLNVDWLYNWNLDRASPLDWEYVPIRQSRYWPGLDEDWKARGATHVLGYNEPDHTDQANMTVVDAIASWPDLLWPGLRVGAPAVSDGGLSWLYDFMAQADAAGLRVDYVPVHYYRCYGNVGDPNGTATQFYNFLKGIYDVVKRPLWVTEWNNGANWTGCADPTFAQQQAAVAAMINMLDSTPFVERYALYNWVEDVRRVKWDDGSLTDAGITYRDQVSPLAYKQEMSDAGTGSSARYSFDGDTHDGWGNGQDAMRVGAPIFTAGKSGEAIALNGTSDYLQVSPRIGDSADWSFAGWVYWNGGGNWQRIFDLGDDTSHQLFLTPKSGNGTLRFTIINGAGEQQLNAPALPVGVWTHVAVTIAGDTGKLFVNGVGVASNTAMTINPVDVGTKYNYLGKSRFPADALFSGRFDDFRFVSSALTDAQVAAIYGTPPPQFWSSTIYKADAPAGIPYSAVLTGDVTGSGPLTFSKMDGPSWLNVSAAGNLTGTPSLANGGINNFLVRVTDTNGSIHTATVLIAVPTVTVSVGSSADDAEQSASGAMSLTSTDLELVNDDATGAGNQIIGLRFPDLSIPRGAIVTSATIQFTADESQSETTVLELAAEASDNAVAFTTTANDIGSRSRVPLTVPWQPDAWTAGQSNASQRTPNLAGLVQEVVSRPGWASGNALVFFLSGTGHRTAESFDKAPGTPARLTVSFSSPTPMLTVATSVRSSADDAEQVDSGAVSLTSTDLELVNDVPVGNQTVGVRFDHLALPGNAIVAGANIQFSADEAQSEPTLLTLRAQAADNPGGFSTAANNITSRPLTAAAVSWSPSPWNIVDERGPVQRTPDLSALVREVLARPSWSKGNAMVFIVSGSGHRTADSADDPGGVPATLIVNYWPELPVGSYARWAAARGSLSPGGDTDGDHYNNLMEYALGLDPTVIDKNATPLVLNSGSLSLTYNRPVGVTDVSYQVEWSDRIDSNLWSSVGVTQEIVNDDGVQRTIRTTIPRGGTGQRFVRLKVSGAGLQCGGGNPPRYLGGYGGGERKGSPPPYVGGYGSGDGKGSPPPYVGGYGS